MTGILRVPRSRGALSGVLLILLGAWGALIPLVGPYFHYGYTPDTTWTVTSGRIWLEIVPGAAAFIGGLVVLTSSLRPVAMFGAWLAALSGAWFAVGTTLSPLWAKGTFAGSPTGGTVHRVAEQIGFFTGLGVVIAFLAALVIGRLSVIGVRDARLAESREARSAEAAAEERRIAEDRRIAQEHRAAEDQRAAQDADLSDADADPAADGSAASDPAADDEAAATRA
jgi:hypothetical protein